MEITVNVQRDSLISKVSAIIVMKLNIVILAVRLTSVINALRLSPLIKMERVSVKMKVTLLNKILVFALLYTLNLTIPVFLVIWNSVFCAKATKFVQTVQDLLYLMKMENNVFVQKLLLEMGLIASALKVFIFTKIVFA